MTENEPTTQTTEEPVESGALEDDSTDLDAQEGKGYGADEGERDEALDE
ncbi:MAG TPA: hypothetical protein VNT23_06905 [Gaiellaceae bacterium]|nr:hypothetical protein [Gaiellaceae bacterium]